MDGTTNKTEPKPAAPDTTGVPRTPEAKTPVRKRVSPATRMTRLARLARARGFHWTAFYNLYAAAVVEGDRNAGTQLAEVLTTLRPTHRLMEIDEAFRHALWTPWERPSVLVRPIVDYLLLDPDLARLTEDQAPEPADVDAAAAQLAHDDLFAALLQTTVVSDLRFERLMIVLRDHLLAAAPSAPGALRLAALLATQANLIEYLWPIAAGTAATQSARSCPPPPVTGARALLNSMFRPPNAAEIAAIESIAVDPAIACLLERVRDEPALTTRHRDAIESAALNLGTSALERRSGSRSCARWVKAPLTARRLPLAIHRRTRSKRFERPEILVAGCGSGQDLVSVRATYPRALITALDSGMENLAYAARRCAEIGLQSIDFVPGSLMDVAPLGWTFDVIECLGLQRNVPDADFGCEALARCSRPGTLVRLAVYGDATCRLLDALRRAAKASGISRALPDLQRFRSELLQGAHGALPPALLQSPQFFTASGMRDLLFADGDVALGTSAWVAMLDVHGFDFICEEVNSELVRAARAAGFFGASVWSIRDSRRFEREQAFAFGGTQYLWFERRGGVRI